MQTILRGKVRLVQPDGAGTTGDAIILAAALDEKAMKGRLRILDAGTGNGSVALCVLKRFAAAEAVGIDILPEMAAAANESAEINGLSERFRARQGDITSLKSSLQFDAVLTNPPYFPGGRDSPNPIRRSARSLTQTTLAEWVAACGRNLKSNGLFAMVYDAGRLGEILCAIIHAKMGGVEVFPFAQKRGADASRVAVRATKGSKSPLILHPPIAMHDESGFARAFGMILEEGITLVDALEYEIAAFGV